MDNGFLNNITVNVGEICGNCRGVKRHHEQVNEWMLWEFVRKPFLILWSRALGNPAIKQCSPERALWQKYNFLIILIYYIFRLNIYSKGILRWLMYVTFLLSPLTIITRCFVINKWQSLETRGLCYIMYFVGYCFSYCYVLLFIHNSLPLWFC